MRVFPGHFALHNFSLVEEKPLKIVASVELVFIIAERARLVVQSPQMNKFPSFIRTPLEFIGSVRVELASVKWPSRAETTRLTLLVIGISVFVGFYIGGLDLLFTTLLQRLINP